jgi:hypothetical protein
MVEVYDLQDAFISFLFPGQDLRYPVVIEPGF